MKFGSALAALAVATLAPSMPAIAAKDDKLPRCNARQKRPANLYGTVLPTVPDRGLSGTAAVTITPSVPRGTPDAQTASPSTPSPAQNLFPTESAPPAPQGSAAPQAGTVPAIDTVAPPGGPTAALPTSYASC